MSNQQLDIAYFIELQRRVFEILRYVSCHERNFDTYSIVIESLLVDSGSFLDSLSQTLIRTKSSGGYHFKQESALTNFAKKASGVDDFNFGDYRTLLEGEFTLSSWALNLNPYEDAFYPNPISLLPVQVSGYPVTPFREWAKGAPSPWWSAFTDLKHNRLKNFRQATLGNAIHTLAAVFIVLTLNNETDFKAGNVLTGIYDLFLPKYWNFKGRLVGGPFLWQ